MKKIIFFCLALCLPYLLSAQLNTVYDEDMNAISLSAGLEKGKEANGLSVNVGLSIKSKYEIEGSYVRTNFNTQDQYTYDGYINGFSGTVTWWWLSRLVDNSTSFNLGLKGGLDSYDYKNYYYWKDADTFLEYSGYSVAKLGLDMCMNHWIDEQLIVRPFASAFYEVGKSSTIFQYSGTESVVKGITGKIGASLMKKLNYNDIVFVSPSLLFNYHDRRVPVMFNLSVGMMVGY